MECGESLPFLYHDVEDEGVERRACDVEELEMDEMLESVVVGRERGVAHDRKKYYLKRFLVLNPDMRAVEWEFLSDVFAHILTEYYKYPSALRPTRKSFMNAGFLYTKLRDELGECLELVGDDDPHRSFHKLRTSSVRRRYSRFWSPFWTECVRTSALLSRLTNEVSLRRQGAPAGHDGVRDDGRALRVPDRYCGRDVPGVS